MLDMGFRDEVLAVAEFFPSQRQVILLSATLKHRGLATVTRDQLQDPQTIAVSEVRALRDGMRVRSRAVAVGTAPEPVAGADPS